MVEEITTMHLNCEKYVKYVQANNELFDPISWLRSLKEWNEMIEVDDKKVARFVQVANDTGVCGQITDIEIKNVKKFMCDYLSIKRKALDEISCVIMEI
jgi:hypothetical protein